MDKTKKGYNRRDFLTTIGSAAAAGLLAKVPLGAQMTPVGAKAAEPGPKPLTRVLGKTGIRFPIVSMGVPTTRRL